MQKHKLCGALANLLPAMVYDSDVTAFTKSNSEATKILRHGNIQSRVCDKHITNGPELRAI